MRIIQNFNQHWLFRPEQVEQDGPDDGFEGVTLPHTNKLFTQRFVDNYDYQFVSTYRKRFSVAEHTGQRIFIDFDGAMLASSVYLNGTLLGEHQGGYTPFSFEMTDHVRPGENVLTVYVDATENEDIPPYGKPVDFLTFGGLYRDVSLRMVDPDHITNAFVRPTHVLTQPGLECDIQLAQWARGLSLEGFLQDVQGRTVARHIQEVGAASITLVFPELEPVALWTLENPVLYQSRPCPVLNGTPVDQEIVRRLPQRRILPRRPFFAER
jgi:beta-galactosidase